MQQKATRAANWTYCPSTGVAKEHESTCNPFETCSLWHACAAMGPAEGSVHASGVQRRSLSHASYAVLVTLRWPPFVDIHGLSTRLRDQSRLHLEQTCTYMSRRNLARCRSPYRHVHMVHMLAIDAAVGFQLHVV